MILEFLARVIITIGGSVLIGFGLMLMFFYLRNSLLMLLKKQLRKNTENDGFLLFFFGGLFRVLPLICFLIYAGLYWIDSFWNIGLPKPF